MDCSEALLEEQVLEEVPPVVYLEASVNGSAVKLELELPAAETALAVACE